MTIIMTGDDYDDADDDDDDDDDDDNYDDDDDDDDANQNYGSLELTSSYELHFLSRMYWRMKTSV